MDFNPVTEAYIAKLPEYIGRFLVSVFSSIFMNLRDDISIFLCRQSAVFLLCRTPALFLFDAWYASLYRGGILRGASRKNLTNYEEDGGIPIDLAFTDQLPATLSTAIHLALPVVVS